MFMKGLLLKSALIASLLIMSHSVFSQCRKMAEMYVSNMVDTTFGEFFGRESYSSPQYQVDDVYYDEIDESFTAYFTIDAYDESQSVRSESFEAYFYLDGGYADITSDSDTAFFLFFELSDLSDYTFVSNNTEATIPVYVSDINSSSVEEYEIGPGEYLYYNCGDEDYALFNPKISVVNMVSEEKSDIHLEKGAGYYFETVGIMQYALKQEDINDILLY
jgi:hypothetical protein